MIVLILTDSLSLPRQYENIIVEYQNTYPFLLRKEFESIDFIHIGIGGATIKTLLDQCNYQKYSNPDLVILQCGIVDCAPRAFNIYERKITEKLNLIKFLKPYTSILRKYRKIQYTKPNNYKKHLISISNMFSKSKVVALEILPASKAYEKKVPGISSEIKRYNEIQREIITTINNDDFNQNGLLPDLFHLNKDGHHLIFKKISILLEEFQ